MKSATRILTRIRENKEESSAALFGIWTRVSSEDEADYVFGVVEEGMDDILVATRTIQEHITALRALFH